MKIKFLFFIANLLIITSVQSENLISSNQKQALSVSDKNRFDYYYFEAQKRKNLQQFDAAMEAFRICFEIDSLNADIIHEIGMIHIVKDELPEAIKCFEKAVAFEPSSWWYRMRYLWALKKVEQLQTAIEQAEELKKYYPQKIEVYETLTILYKQAGDFDKAIQSLTQLEKFTGIREETTIEKFELYASLGKEKQAIKEIENLIKKHPKDSRYKLLLANIYMGTGNQKKGLKIYDNVKKEDPDNPDLYVSLAIYYSSLNQIDKASESILAALKNTKLSSDEKMGILAQYVEILLMDNNKIDEIEGLFKFLIEMYPFEELPHIYYSVFLQNQKRESEALVELENTLNINPKNVGAWKNILEIAVEKQDTVRILQITEQAIQEIPTVPDFYFYRSMIFYHQGDFEQAIQINKTAIENIEKNVNKSVLSTFYGQLGDIYYKTNDKEKAFESYEKSLELQPINSYVMNNYAYFLSEEKKDLRKAERMSGKTVEAEPNNSTYLDTYAWILYQQGNYSLAKLYIDKAISNLKENDGAEVIYEHCGDIYFALDNYEKAIEMWQKAQVIDVENEQLKEKIDSVLLLQEN